MSPCIPLLKLKWKESLSCAPNFLNLSKHVVIGEKKSVSNPSTARDLKNSLIKMSLVLWAFYLLNWYNKCAYSNKYSPYTPKSSTLCIHLLVGERNASLQPCLKPGSTPRMTQPLTGHTSRRWRRFRTNMAIDSFSAALVSLVLYRGKVREKQRWRKEWWHQLRKRRRGQRDTCRHMAKV